ncbi:MAG: succinylglutamate desuccinylase/aspartoacylase family protein [Oscillospiraceae bacterium]|nr:succinylglutamate desuccinylase/aspartoacylase family protein [Oscillospiraceae bacterium]
MEIAGYERVPGETVKDYSLAEGTDILVPYVLLWGAREGPTVVVTAGIHCAEYVGIDAALRLSLELDPAELAGNVVILPLCNRSGFEHRTMSTVYEDGKNLNRVFPGDPEGTAAQRLADMLYRTFISKADAYIDLHSGDGYEGLVPFAYYVGGTSVEKESAEMLECIDVPLCVRSRCTEGGAYNTASAAGIPSVLIERGCMGVLDRGQSDADMEDVRNILRRLGVLKGEYRTYPKTELEEYDEPSPITGLWYPEMRVGQRFSKGDRFGEIKDCFGRVLHTAIARRDGILLYQTQSLNILCGGPMVAYGAVRTQSNQE